jgi:ubiquitin-conjugating enzyme E2 W
MDVTETKSPTLNKCLRSCLRTIEKLTGLKLLPRLLSSPSSSPASKTKKNKKKKSKVKQDMVRDEDGDQKEQEKASDESVSKSKSKPKPKPQAVSHTTKEHLTSSITKSNPNHRIQKELKEFIKHPPDSLSVQVGKNIRIWIITIKGAKGSIYEGETFKLRVSFPKEYPTVPPSVYFLKGYIPKHEHVYTNGDICLSLLGKDWRPIMTAQSIAVSIQSILSSATKKTLPMDNAQHANAKPGEYQKDWVYHDDQC